MQHLSFSKSRRWRDGECSDSPPLGNAMFTFKDMTWHYFFCSSSCLQ